MREALLAGHDPVAIAAALLRLYQRQLPPPETITAAPGPGARLQGPGKKPANRAPPPGRHPPPSPSSASAVGRRDNADPKWLVPLICRAGGVTKRGNRRHPHLRPPIPASRSTATPAPPSPRPPPARRPASRASPRPATVPCRRANSALNRPVRAPRPNATLEPVVNDSLQRRNLGLGSAGRLTRQCSYATGETLAPRTQRG